MWAHDGDQPPPPPPAPTSSVSECSVSESAASEVCSIVQTWHDIRLDMFQGISSLKWLVDARIAADAAQGVASRLTLANTTVSALIVRSLCTQAYPLNSTFFSFHTRFRL